MIGILDFGVYIPYFRLSRQAIGQAWAMEQARKLLVGERAVANYDEDPLTMAVEAALSALGPRPAPEIEGLLFASTSAPFAEKSSAAVIAAACDLPVTRTTDFGGSLRAGTTALSVAFDALRAGSYQQAVVVAADMRSPPPGTLQDAISGDGAGALLVGTGDEVLAELLAEVHLSDPTVDVWRRAEDRYLQSDDEAFTRQVGYFALVNTAADRLLSAAGVAAEEVQSVAVYAPDGRAYMRLGKQSPLAPALARLGMQAPAPQLLMGAGDLGAASPFVQLAMALENAGPGDLIAMIGYGDGADAYLFRATPALASRSPRPTVQDWLAARRELPSYTLMLQFRQHLRDRPLFPPDAEPWTSLPLLQRERQELLNFHAQRCSQCGAVWWPHRPSCYECGAQDSFESLRLSRRGEVASFVVEWVVPAPVPPIGMVTVDTPEGARITNPSTDGDPRTLKMGEQVAFSLRVFHTAKNLPHYSWKVRQLRAGA